MGVGAAWCRAKRARCAGGCYVTVKRGLNQSGLSQEGLKLGQAGSHEAGGLRGAIMDGKDGASQEGGPEAASGSRDAGAASQEPQGLFPKRLDFQAIDGEFSLSARPALALDGAWADRRLSLPMPPPNITGRLHLGHALDLGLQDALIRRASSRGARTSWIAGCDHAGQATHEKIMQRWPDLSWDGEAEKARYMGRAELYAGEAKALIMGQFEALAPLTRLESPRFTLDAGYQEAASIAIDELIKKRRIRREGGKLTLDLREEARALIQAIEGGEIEIEPQAHAGRLLSMLREERLWEIGRSFPWGFAPGLSFDDQGWATGREGPAWTLDTWFTSSLWPMAMGEDRFDALIIGYDIAYFWGARMAMMMKALGRGWPFSKMTLHGLIRDSQGRKFSKSLGNGIDPLELIDQRGADALRLWCCSKAAWGMDFKFNPAEFAAGAKWLTKMANACRLLEMRKPCGFEIQAGGGADSCSSTGSLRPWPEGFAERAQAFEREFDLDMDQMRLDKACLAIQAFARADWCEGWLSMDAPKWADDPAAWMAAWRGQKRLLALAHPFAPATTWWLSTRLDQLARG